ncbi:MAG: HD domain-containing protein [Anaerolineales bacterium]
MPVSNEPYWPKPSLNWDSPPAMAFSVPARHNPRLHALVERINADEELWQLWRCANVNAVDRLGLNDHGEVHVRIVANAALKLLRLLREAGHTPAVVVHHHLLPEDAEVMVVLAAALHDLDIAAYGGARAESLTPLLATLKARELLADLYPPRKRAIVFSEALHAIAAHHAQVRSLTLEAGVLTLADALDLAAGRLRRNGADDVAINEVTIRKGAGRPVCVEVHMRAATGLFQVEALLRSRLQQSTLAELVEIVARIEDETGKRLLPLNMLQAA